MTGCVFCRIVDGEEKADLVAQWDRTVAFRPRRPHVPGHVLFVPRFHVRDATESPMVTAYTMADAARWVKSWARGPANILTSIGPESTQTVMHLHIHVVPRGPADGIRKSWPWRVRLSEGLGPGDVFPEEGFEELATQLANPGGVTPSEDPVDKGPSPH